MREYALGTIAGLRLSATPGALLGTALLWAALGLAAAGPLGLPPASAAGAALAATALHWASEIFHQLGHAWAARRAGHPMAGIRLGALLVLSTSLYPPDEPALPGRTHIRRALGGPAASLLLGLAGAALALALRPLGGAIWPLALFFALENVLVFALGALLPLGFNDGGTLLRWWGK